MNLSPGALPHHGAASRRLLWMFSLAITAVFVAALVLPEEFPLLPYYFLPVVLAAGFVTPRQMVPLITQACVMAILSGLHRGFFPSGHFISSLIGLGALSALALYLCALRCRELEKRRRSELILKLTLENAAAGVALADASGRLFQVNPAFCEILGRNALTLCALSWEDITHPDDLEQERGLLEEMRANLRSNYRIKKRYLRADGAAIWIDAHVSCSRLPSGEVDFFIGQLIDITAQKQAEQALASSEELFRLSAEESSVGLAFCAPGSGRFLLTNQEFCSEIGCDPVSLQNVTLPEFLASYLPEEAETTALRGPAAGEASGAAMLAALLQGELEHHRLHLRLRRGERFSGWASLRLSNVRDTSGVVRHVLVELIDISEIVAKSDYLQAAAEAGVVGIWDWDPVHDVLTWDPVMYQLYGRRRDQFAGAYEAWAAAVHPDDRAYAEAEIQAGLRGEREYAPRFRVVWPDGSIRHLQAASHTSFDGQGRPVRMLGVNYDVTELVNTQQRLEGEQQRLRTTLDSLLDPHVMLEPIRDGEGRLEDLRVVHANPAAAVYNRMAPEEMVGASLLSLWPGHGSNGLLESYWKVLSTGESLSLDNFLYRHHERLGGDRHVDIRAVKVGEVLSLTWRDVTERALAQQRLAASEQRFRLLAENVSDVVLHCASDGTVLWVSPSLLAVLGWPSHAWVGRRLQEVLPSLDPERRPLIGPPTPGQGRAQVSRERICAQDGTPHWIECRWSPFHGASGAEEGWVCSFHLIDTELAAERELERRASTDSLTALLNRDEVFSQIRRLTQSNQRLGRELAVLFCDLDHFKHVNDSYGHQAGDAVLRAMAERVRSCLRASDVAARIGGDELLVVLPGLQRFEDAIDIAEKLRQRAREPVPLPGGEEAHITVSVGVALAQPDESIDDLIARADGAMFSAKQKGRDQVMAIGIRPAGR
ncbi:PAS domain S-box protein [Synechococcus sp. CS-1328]|uniref:PAS domain S-box protein n=1 Tax=Synechococcus sp. CS-1328 TaxID=2847976 RepID=UPI00223B898D|nr:PAS domain S-box protein [Synechococcus sp. CS-1328]MCT0223839.1 PAS domain S-box protein [Synechococcus sp. CS-1328]